MEFFTIGVYNSSENEFFSKIVSNQIDTFCDIRQRRGVRGAKYSFVNSKKLQEKLKSLNIRYHHVLDLAPTPEIRELQKISDQENRIQKRDRSELGEVFKTQYKEQVLSEFDISKFIEGLRSKGSTKVVFFCVEEKPKACHRSIVGDAIRNQTSYSIEDL